MCNWEMVVEKSEKRLKQQNILVFKLVKCTHETSPLYTHIHKNYIPE